MDLESRESQFPYKKRKKDQLTCSTPPEQFRLVFLALVVHLDNYVGAFRGFHLVQDLSRKLSRNYLGKS